MDPARFDRLVAAMTQPGTRRRALRVALVGALLPAAAAAAPQPAKCLAVGKRCSQPSAEDDRHGRGTRKGKKGNGKHHPPSCDKCCSRLGAPGLNGKSRCACKSEGIECANPSQCCSGDCRDGTCTACPPNTVFCPDGCANLQTANNHCGSCETACAAGQRCVGGDCVCDGTSCPNGGCDGTACRRGTSDQACGDGGVACAICGEGKTCCGGACTNTDVDPKNCSACGFQCPDIVGVLCISGTCCQDSSGNARACSETMPCCRDHQCQEGHCCLTSGATCVVATPDVCCSNVCAPVDPNCNDTDCFGRCQ